MNQAVDAAVQADEDTEVSDRLDFTFNTVALVVGFRELLPRVSFALFQTQGDTTTFFVDIQTITSTTSPTLTTLDGWMFLLVQSISETCTRPSIPASTSTKAP